MLRNHQWFFVVSFIAGLSCLAGPALSAGGGDDYVKRVHPVKIEPIKGSKLKQITLTARAAKRLGIVTVPVHEKKALAKPPSTAQETGVKVAMSGRGSPQTAIPYSALLYDPQGGTWVYTNPKPLIYIRHAVDVDRIFGNTVLLSSGPPVGTEVVIIGGMELFGAEFEIGH